MLALELELSETRYAPGTPILVTLALRNDGPDAPVVKTRLAVNTPLAPAVFRDVSFALTGPAGAALAFNARVGVGLPKARHFAGLAPGDSLVRTCALSQYFHLPEPGRYTLQARYYNYGDSPDGRTAWKGELSSNVVSFWIEG